MKRLLGAVLSGLLTMAAFGANAQDYPTQPIKIVVPYAPGGGTDTLTRLVAEEMARTLGQPVIIENRPGASTFIGAEMVAKAAPDGHTLLASAASTFSINPNLYEKLPYDPSGSFAPISTTGNFPLLLVVSKDFPAKTVAELIKLAKEKPGALDFASAGNGSTHHLAMEYFMQSAGIKMQHVPYRGAAPAMQDVMGGRVPIMFLDVAVASGPLASGLIRALGVADSKRLVDLPDVPTIAEAAGLANFEAAAWNGIVAPAGTPQPIINKLNATIVSAVQTPAIAAKMRALGIVAMPNTPADFVELIRSDTRKWGDVIKKGNVELSK